MLAIYALFESRERLSKDRMEVRSYFRKYGDETIEILKSRAQDKSLTDRDRRHWRRLWRKAKSLGD